MSSKAISAREDGPVVHSPTARDPEWEPIRRALQGIRFGEVRVIIQDGVVVQIERVEKQRLR